MVDIFRDPTTSLPATDKPQEPIDRFTLDVLEIGGRKSHLPVQQSPAARIHHVPNYGK